MEIKYSEEDKKLLADKELWAKWYARESSNEKFTKYQEREKE